MPLKLRKELDADPFYKVCSRFGQQGHQCQGRVTFNHAIIFAGKQLQEKWAIQPLCEFGHSVDKFQDGGDFDEEINLWIVLNRATEAELRRISKAVNYLRQRERLNKIYGEYKPVVPTITTPDKIAQPRPAKKFWYPLSEGEQLIVERMRLHHIEIEEVHYTPFQMIHQMIVAYEEATNELIKNQ